MRAITKSAECAVAIEAQYPKPLGEIVAHQPRVDITFFDFSPVVGPSTTNVVNGQELIMVLTAALTTVFATAVMVDGCGPVILLPFLERHVKLHSGALFAFPVACPSSLFVLNKELFDWLLCEA